MEQAEFDGVVKETVEAIGKLLTVKGGEYAGSADRLSNFKRGATLTGATPLQVAFVYASKHYDGIATYVRRDAGSEKQVMSEPIEGRLDDLINYCILMKAIIKEKYEVRATKKNLGMSQTEQTKKDYKNERSTGNASSLPFIASWDRPGLQGHLSDL